MDGFSFRGRSDRYVDETGRAFATKWLSLGDHSSMAHSVLAGSPAFPPTLASDAIPREEGTEVDYFPFQSWIVSRLAAVVGAELHADLDGESFAFHFDVCRDRTRIATATVGGDDHVVGLSGKAATLAIGEEVCRAITRAMLENPTELVDFRVQLDGGVSFGRQGGVLIGLRRVRVTDPIASLDEHIGDRRVRPASKDVSGRPISLADLAVRENNGRPMKFVGQFRSAGTAVWVFRGRERGTSFRTYVYRDWRDRLVVANMG